MEVTIMDISPILIALFAWGVCGLFFMLVAYLVLSPIIEDIITFMCRRRR